MILVIGWKKRLRRDAKFLFVGIVLVSIVYHFSNVLESTGITPFLDIYKYTIEILIPILWFFFFYAVLQNITREDLHRTEEKFRILSEKSLLGVYIIQDNVFKYVNPMLAETLGYSVDEMVNKKSPFDLTVEEDYERAKENIRKRLSGEVDSIRYEFKGKKKNGDVIFLESYGSRIDYKGKPAIIGTLLNITEHKKAEEALRESEERFRIAAKCASDLIYEWDILTNHLEWYGNIDEILGYEPNEFPRTLEAWENIIHPDDHNRVMSAVEHHLKTGEPYSELYQVRRKDGKYLYWTDKGIALRDEKNNPYKWIGVNTDITEHLMDLDKLQQSEETYRLLFESNPHPMWVYDLETLRNLTVNDTFIRQYGYSREEFLSMTLKDIHPLEDVPALINKVAEVAKEISFSGIWRHLKKDGTIINAEIISHPLTFMGRQARLVLAIDVTDRKRAEEALRREHDIVNRIMETSPAGITLVNKEGKITFANAEAENVLGLKKEEIIQRTYSDPNWRITDFNGNPFPDEKLPFRLVMTTGKPVYDFRHAIEWSDGRRILLSINAAPLFDSSGNIDGMVATVENITEKIKAEEQRRKLEAQIQYSQKLESLGVLAGGIAHDFNNLLTGVLGNANLALMEILPDSPAQETIKQIEKSAMRAAELCKQMLIYTGRTPFSLQPLNLTELIDEMVHLIEVSVPLHAVVKYNLAKQLRTIEGDPTQIRQVIMNLVTNASESIGDQGGEITISTGVMECNRSYLRDTYLDDNLPAGYYVYLEVADTGCGMDEETRAKIFEPFFTTKFTGRGLGLATVFGIVRGHRGAIKVSSEPGQGTIFRVLFPSSAKLPTDMDISIKDLEKWQGKGSILVIDDEEVVRLLTKRILEKAGFKVLLACDGREGVEIFRVSHKKIIAVILDMTMPYFGGEEVFDEMQRIKHDIPTILSSGYSEEETAERFKGRGLAGFIQKPYRPADLVAKLCEVLGKSV